MAWDFDVPVDLIDPLDNLLSSREHRGEFTLQHVVDFSATHGNEERLRRKICRLSPASKTPCRCLGKVQVWKEEWHVIGTPAALPLIKINIRLAYIGTQATA